MNDVVIIGWGPAGLMAGIFAARSGAKFLILERMREPLRKPKITGKGRCNLTHTADRRAFPVEIGPQPNFLKPAFHRFTMTTSETLQGRLGSFTRRDSAALKEICQQVRLEFGLHQELT
jgi:predicted flavoprotein YhiN